MTERSRIRCPECNSSDITSTFDILTRITNLFTIDLPFFISKEKDKKRHHCNDCGYNWTVWFTGQAW